MMDSYIIFMTVCMGGQPFEVYQQIVQDLELKEINYKFTVLELAMRTPG
jgi:hypothetical protein